MPSKQLNKLLARVNFPLYTVATLTERHILVAGGGGGAKTGIPNIIEIYELINNGSSCRAESVTHYETGNEAIMNCTVFRQEKYFVLLAGMEGNCQVFKIKLDFSDESDITPSMPEEQNHVRYRKRKQKVTEKKDAASSSDLKSPIPDSNANVLHPRLCFSIEPLKSFQTDFSDDPFQKLVRFSNVTSIIATGGADGHLRLWHHPELNKVFDIEAHSNDVDDLDICPLGKKIVTVSRDGHAKLWNAESGSLITELKYILPSKNEAKYIFRSCRFSILGNKGLSLFATINPAIRKRPPSKCFVCKWDMSDYSQQKIVPCGVDASSVMAVSDSGNFIGLGTQEGSVKIYNSINLKQLYQANHIHGIFVTGLQFLPTIDESRRIAGGHKASLISISVDNHIIIHHIPVEDSIGVFTLTSIIFMILLFIFVLMDYFQL